jgi:hypothetical protein
MRLIHIIAVRSGPVVSASARSDTAKKPPVGATLETLDVRYLMYGFLEERRSLWLRLRRAGCVRQPFPHRIERGLGAADQVQLAKDPAHVGARNGLADHDPVGDLLVAQPLGNQPAASVISHTLLGRVR